MADKTKPTSLQDVLQADEARIREWSAQSKIELDELMHPEEQLVMALLQVPAPEQAEVGLEETSQTQTKASWWSQLVEKLSVSQLSFALASVVVVVGLTTYSLQPAPTEPANPFAGSKGIQGPHTTKKRFKRASLHIGMFNQKKALDRVATGSSISSQKKLVIGFSVFSPGGYISIFRQSKRQAPELVYPCDHTSRDFQKAGEKIRFLACKGQILQDDLTDEKGALSYIQLQTTKPLTKTQQESFRKGTPQKRQHLLRDWFHQKLLQHFDRFDVQIKEAPR